MWDRGGGSPFPTCPPLPRGGCHWFGIAASLQWCAREPGGQGEVGALLHWACSSSSSWSDDEEGGCKQRWGRGGSQPSQAPCQGAHSRSAPFYASWEQSSWGRAMQITSRRRAGRRWGPRGDCGGHLPTSVVALGGAQGEGLGRGCVHGPALPPAPPTKETSAQAQSWCLGLVGPSAGTLWWDPLPVPRPSSGAAHSSERGHKAAPCPTPSLLPGTAGSGSPAGTEP